MTRLFVAVWLPCPARRALAGLARPDEPDLRWTTEGAWHATLRFLGDADEQAAHDALGRAVGSVGGPVPARLADRTERFGRSVLHVPVAGLDALAAEVVGATAHLGRPPDARPFRAHVTLARARDRRGSTAVARLAGLPVEPVAWEVGSVALVASRLGRGGAEHTTLASLPLAVTGAS